MGASEMDGTGGRAGGRSREKCCKCNMYALHQPIARSQNPRRIASAQHSTASNAERATRRDATRWRALALRRAGPSGVRRRRAGFHGRTEPTAVASASARLASPRVFREYEYTNGGSAAVARLLSVAGASACAVQHSSDGSAAQHIVAF